MSETIRIDVWTDVSCPFCYVGNRRLEIAKAAFEKSNPGVRVEIEGHSFHLAPDMPEAFEGSEQELLVNLGSSPEEVSRLHGQLTAMGAPDQLTFDWIALRPVNTARAHRVLQYAKEQGLRSAMLHRLFRAYFAEGRVLSDPDTLAALGEEVGLDATAVREAVHSEAYDDAANREHAVARELGINSAPFFLLDRKYAVSGAQSVESFISALEQVLEKQRSDTMPDDVTRMHPWTTTD